MPNDTVVRAATAEDCPDIARMAGEVHLIHMRMRRDVLQRQAPVMEYLKTLIQDVYDFDKVVLVAERGGRVAGFVWGYVRETPNTPYERKRSDLVVMNIGVEEEFRRQGIASMLVAAAEAKGVELGATGVELDVWAGNPAEAFYQAVGYAPHRTTLTKPIGAERKRR